MIQVSFHTRVPDKFGYACRLLRKAYRAGSRVVVTGPDADLAALDKALWTFEPLEFVPHARQLPGPPNAVRVAATPVWLVPIGQEPPHHDVLVNLGPAVAPGFESFKRVIELISIEPDDVQAGRKRWKHYVERGYAVTHHEVSA
ncbi:DNA polymerase III subunit chi [soil metagenome]